MSRVWRRIPPRSGSMLCFAPPRKRCGMVARRWGIPFSFASGLARNAVGGWCLLTLMIGACSRPTPPIRSTSPISAPNAPDAGFLNGWRKGQDARQLARTWYQTPQGSHLLDFDVFMSIPSASDQELFSSRSNLESYGFLYTGDYGDSGLPIGMLKDTRGEGHTPLAKHAQDLTRDYVGLTCAACHT